MGGVKTGELELGWSKFTTLSKATNWKSRIKAQEPDRKEMFGFFSPFFNFFQTLLCNVVAYIFISILELQPNALTKLTITLWINILATVPCSYSVPCLWAL